jgi:hypothetical protein
VTCTAFSNFALGFKSFAKDKHSCYLFPQSATKTKKKFYNFDLMQGTLTEEEGSVQLTSMLRWPFYKKRNIFSLQEEADLN